MMQHASSRESGPHRVSLGGWEAREEKMGYTGVPFFSPWTDPSYDFSLQRSLT